MSHEQMIRSYYEAWAKHNPEEIAAFFTEDAVFEDLAFGVQFDGHAGVGQFAAITFQGAPDFTIEVEDVVVDGDRAAATWIMRGTHQGDMPGFAADGKAFEIRASSRIIMRDGKIQRMVDYWNPDSLREK